MRGYDPAIREREHAFGLSVHQRPLRFGQQRTGARERKNFKQGF
jgi:hypothetical protein